MNRILFHYAPSTGEAPCCYDTIVGGDDRCGGASGDSFSACVR